MADGTFKIGARLAAYRVANADGENTDHIQKVALADSSGAAVNPAAPVLAAGENVIGKVGTPADVITVTPVCETSALDAGDVIFDATIITGAARTVGGVTSLNTLVIADLADQKAVMTLVFFNAATSLGTLDAAPDIDDTEVLTVVGYLDIAAADYKDLGTSSVVCLRNLALEMKAGASANLWVAAFTPGTPTYAAASALQFKFGFVQA